MTATEDLSTTEKRKLVAKCNQGDVSHTISSKRYYTSYYINSDILLFQANLLQSLGCNVAQFCSDGQTVTVGTTQGKLSPPAILSSFNSYFFYCKCYVGL